MPERAAFRRRSVAAAAAAVLVVSTVFAGTIAPASAAPAAAAAPAAVPAAAPDALSSAATGLTSASASPLASEDGAAFECADLLIVGVRGSGETADQADGYGHKVGAAIQRLHTLLDGDRTTRYIALDYPSAAMSVLLDDLIDNASLNPSHTWGYFDSIDGGVAQLSATLQASLDSCPNERWVLVGYSQGALVIDETTAAFDIPARYAGILKIADPAREASVGPRNFGTADGIGSGLMPTFHLTTPLAPSSLTPRTVEVCHTDDLVCDTSHALIDGFVLAGALAGAEIHGSYTSSMIEPAADVIAQQALDLPARVVTSPQPVCGGAHDVSGTAQLKVRPSGASAVTWSLWDGYQPVGATSVSGNGFSLGDGEFFLIGADGSYVGTLPDGFWSIPLVATTGATSIIVLVEFGVSAICDDPTECGPSAHPAGEQLLPEYAHIRGRIVCPSGVPAAGVTVTLLRAVRLSSGSPWLTYQPIRGIPSRTTDEAGRYAFPRTGMLEDHLVVKVESEGFPDLYLDADGTSFVLPTVDELSFASGEATVVLPAHRLVRYGSLTVSPRLNAFPEYYTWDQVMMDVTPVQSRVSTERTGWCLRYPEPGNGKCFSDSTSLDANGSASLENLLPGEYDVLFSGSFYQWYGTQEPLLEPGSPPLSARITIRQGEVTDLGEVLFSPGSIMTGTAEFSSRPFIDPAWGHTQLLPVDVFTKVGGTWTKVVSKGGAVQTADPWDQWGGFDDWYWYAHLTLGTQRLLINDPTSLSYNPAYETFWYPDATTVDAAADVTTTAGKALAGLTIRPRLKGAGPTDPTEFAAAPTPTISGTVKVASTVTAVAGTWSPSPTTLTYQWRRNGVAIGGATGKSYTLAAADAGTSVTVAVTAKRAGYATTTRTSAAKVVAALGFTTAPTPKITGTATAGYVLTAVAGTWAPKPAALSYQWKRNGVAIDGATAATYKLSAADAAATVTVTTTASRSGYSTTSRTSAGKKIATRPFTTAPAPTIKGTVRVGSTVTAGTGTWSPAPTSFSYRWLRNGVSITGATAATYTLQPGDAGKTITVKVTARRAGYTTTTRTSSAKTVPREFTAAPTPTVSGSSTVGATLTAKSGTWSPAPSSLTYQWRRNGSPISGATGTRYKLTRADAGATITVTVTAKRTGYATTARSSAGRTIG